MPTEQGSPLFAGWEGKRDCAAAVALREAGAVVVGKTVTTEFAATQARGTRNPYDTTRTPGGSSSGSAAAVGSGMLSAALGSQVIGSIIRPSSFCGAYGYKPSVGGINRRWQLRRVQPELHRRTCRDIVGDLVHRARNYRACRWRCRLSGPCRTDGTSCGFNASASGRSGN